MIGTAEIPSQQYCDTSLGIKTAPNKRKNEISLYSHIWEKKEGKNTFLNMYDILNVECVLETKSLDAPAN